MPELDAIVASVSGGGFIAGTAVAAKVGTFFCDIDLNSKYMQALRPGIKVFAAEPERADDCARSMAAGRIVPNESWPDTICDALKYVFIID